MFNALVTLLSVPSLCRADENYTPANAEYQVPMAEAAAPYSHFALTGAQYQEINGHVTIRYSLPHELVGNAGVEITLQGTATSGLTHLEGLTGEASCIEKSDTVVCLMNLFRLHIAPGAADGYLDSRYTDATELSTRKLVAESFRGDPVGIVSYRK